MIPWLVPIVSLAVLALWTWTVCETLRRERDYVWLFATAFVPPIGIPLYLLNFYILKDDKNGLTAMRRRSKNRGRIVELKDLMPSAETVSRREELAETLLSDKRPAEALQEIKPLLDADPENLAAQYIAARGLVELGKSEQALPHLEYIYEQDRSFRSWNAALLYAKALDATGNHTGAENVYAVLMDRNVIAEVIYSYAEHLKQSGKVEESRALLTKLVAQFTDDPGFVEARDREWIRLAKRSLSE